MSAKDWAVRGRDSSMSNSIPSGPQIGTPANSVTNHKSPVEESVRILTIRRCELASFARHLSRLRRRQQEQEEHLAHTRKQVDGLMERSRQQIAQIQSGSPERNAELEKALTQSRNDVEAQRREVARLAGEKASLTQLVAKVPELEKALAQLVAKVPELERALAQARSDAARLAGEKSSGDQLAAKVPELEKALAQARNDVEAQRREVARLAGEKAKLTEAAGQAGKVAELEKALTQTRADLEAQRKEVARMSAEKTQVVGKVSQLEQALTLAQSDLEATRQQIDNLRQAASRIAELEELVGEAAAELEAREKQINELSAAKPAAASSPVSGDLADIVAQLRVEVEEAHLAEFQRMNLDLEALRKGNAKLREELQQAQQKNGTAASEPAKPAPAAGENVAQRENDELKARLAALETSVQKMSVDSEKTRGQLAELEQERNLAIESLEREAAQFNQQRHELEEEVRALRKQVEGGVPAKPAVAAKVEDPLFSEMMEGEIVPEPGSQAEIEIEEPPSDEAPVLALNLDDGFDFARCEAELVGLHTLVEKDHRLLNLELSDPQAQHDERALADLEMQKITMDSLLEQIRQARRALTGKLSVPAVVVAPPKPVVPKPRGTLQGLKRWLKGRE